MENPFEQLEKRICSRIDRLEQLLKEKPAQSRRVGGIEMAAEITGLAPATIYKLVARRRIPFSKPSGTRYLRFSEEKLLAWIEAGNMATEEEIKSDAVKLLRKS